MNFAKASLIAAAVILSAPASRADPAPQPDAAKPGASSSNTGKQDVATLLFGTPQWANAPAGSTITYDYSKKTTDAKFGPSFDDKIVLKLDKGDSDKTRTAEVKMFSGMNAKPAGPFQADEQNPVLLLVFEENVQELSKLYKANPRYLKNAIRKAWRDDAQIEKVDVDLAGKKVPGTRVTVTPFVNDAQKDKMMGLEDMVYIVEIADSAPGEIATIDIHAPATGAAKFSEVLHFKSEEK